MTRRVILFALIAGASLGSACRSDTRTPSGRATGYVEATDTRVASRVGGRIEGIGLDVEEHGEEAYTGGDGAILVTPRDTMFATRMDVMAVQDGGRP